MKKPNKTQLFIVGVSILFIIAAIFSAVTIKENGKGFFGGFSFKKIFKQAEEDIVYNGYKAYMNWIDQGVSGGRIQFSRRLVNLLQPYYRNNLNDVRAAYTNRFSNLAMTDCSIIYFGNSGIVDKLRNNTLFSRSEFSWLAHELTHTEQCDRIGGRKNYAKRWFNEASGVVISAIRSGRFSSIVSDIASAQRLASYDENMSMESSANQRSATVTNAAFNRQ